MHVSPRYLCAAIAAGLGLIAAAAPAEIALQRIGQLNAVTDTAEIISYDAGTNRLFYSHGGGVEIADFGDGSNPSFSGNVDMSYLFSNAVDSVSSVAVDTAGGWAVASVIPEDNANTVGRMVFFRTSDGAILNDQVQTGYHPDMVTIHDGRILVANEGEPVVTGPTTLLDRPGSITVLDVSGLDEAGIAALGADAATTTDFSAPNLNGVSLAGLRVNPTNSGGNEYLDMEPEYIAAVGEKAYVGLQENNALAEFDLTMGKWTGLHDLGALEHTIDASDRDGGAMIDDTVRGLPMPDAIAAYSVGGKTYVLTANEGDSREYIYDEDGPSETDVFVDEDRVKDATLDPSLSMDQSDAGLGRLKFSVIDGDEGDDGDYDEIFMFGTRSFTIWDAETGAAVFDSGDSEATNLEHVTLAAVPEIFNSQGEFVDEDPADGINDELDDRSDDKGPEPEGLTLGEINGRMLAFVGLERVGGIVTYDVTDPENVSFLDYVNTYDLESPGIGPEGLDFFELDGRHFLAVSYEESDSVEVFEVIPEPTTAALLGLGGLAALGRRRRMR